MDFEYFSRGRSTLLRLPDVAVLNRAEHRLNQNFTRILQILPPSISPFYRRPSSQTHSHCSLQYNRPHCHRYNQNSSHQCLRLHQPPLHQNTHLLRICCWFFFFLQRFSFNCHFFLGKQVESRHINRNQFSSL